MQLQLHGAQEHLIDVIRKLYLGVHYVCGADVAGDVAEFGTMTGTTARLLAQALHDLDHAHNGKKKLHLFDSFIGLPDAESDVDRQSPHVQSGAWDPGRCRGISQQQLSDICTQLLPREKVLIYDGWFKDTLCRIPDGTQLALVHVDCDLYQSAMDVFDYCFSRHVIAPGAAVFCDDWNCNRASPQWGERRAWAETVEKYSVEFSDSGEYGWAGHKFIVHGYT